ncbi:RelA/SpoT family protein [Halothiobacillus diazotrophicus]|uniref:RelA/SpoT family protein n=1 Tax=Halothiobacillus diazotrophicus TaxID=1860122 RepID=UPI0012E743C2|nr:HD domain-containing protein [Halothiobacillus diazotrophicus]
MTLEISLMQYALDEPNDLLCAALDTRMDGDSLVRRACNLAGSVWDRNVTRARGPRAALLILDIGADRDTVLACILADPRLLGQVESQTLARDYGPVVADRVGQLQHLLTLGEQYRTHQQAIWLEHLRRLLLSSISDVRVMMIQLVHRLERLRGLPFEPDFAKRRAIAAETLDVYAPIAHRLGLGQLKWELEDLAFRHLEPETYKRIAQLLDERREEREAYIVQVRDMLHKGLAEAHIEARIYGRPKHIYSIWGKMQRKHLGFDGLFDVRALRIEVDSVSDCYAALSVVHHLFSPIESEYDDYIARPKDNGYQSLHTAVHALEGKIIEVQIRTRAMHEQAELGIAAHWRYKEGGQASEDAFTQELNRLRQALATGAPARPEVDQIFVFTPEGDIFAMPPGSTVLDYAYRVHTLVGHRCKGAKINGQIVPLKTRLQQADRIEILTQPQPAPSREWAQAGSGYLQSASARAKVRNWFHKLDLSAARQAGEQQCDRLFRRLGLNRAERADVVAALGLKSEEALYESVGRQRIDSATLLSAARAAHAHSPAAAQVAPPVPSIPVMAPTAELALDGLKAQPAGCCHPRPGDRVLAFITRGQGLRLHKVDCSNIRHLQAAYPERILSVDWPSTGKSWVLPLKLDLLVADVTRFWADLGPVLAPFKAHVVESRSRHERNTGLTDLYLLLELPGSTDVQEMLRRLQRLPAVESVQRRAS